MTINKSPYFDSLMNMKNRIRSRKGYIDYAKNNVDNAMQKEIEEYQEKKQKLIGDAIIKYIVSRHKNHKITIDKEGKEFITFNKLLLSNLTITIIKGGEFRFRIDVSKMTTKNRIILTYYNLLDRANIQHNMNMSFCL